MRHVAGSSGMRKMQCCAGDRREVLQPVRQSGHWMTPAVKLALLTLPPLLAAGAGALVVSVKTPGARTTSVIQHFTGGIVFAAASLGLLLQDRTHTTTPVVIGSVLGLLLTLASGRCATGWRGGWKMQRCRQV